MIVLAPVAIIGAIWLSIAGHYIIACAMLIFLSFGMDDSPEHFDPNP